MIVSAMAIATLGFANAHMIMSMQKTALTMDVSI